MTIAAGVIIVPATQDDSSLFRPLNELRRDLDRFIAEVAPAFR